MKTLVAKFPSEIDLDSFTMETNEESTSDDLDDCIEIHEESYAFTLILVDFEHTDGLLFIHSQLIDWDQQELQCLDTFQNNEAFIDYLGICEDLPLGDHKAGYIIELDSMEYFGEGFKPSSCKGIKINKNRGSYGENHIMVMSEP